MKSRGILLPALCAVITGCASQSIRHVDDFMSFESRAWMIHGENPAAWRYDPQDHSLRISTEAGDLWGGLNNARNVFLRDIPYSGGAELSVHVTFSPSENWQQFGLMFYQDDDNYVVLKALYDRGQALQFGKETRGYFTSLAAKVSLSEAYTLKLVRKGRTITGFFKPDGGDWMPTGSYDVFLNRAQAGILVCNGGSSPAGTREAVVQWFDMKGDNTDVAYSDSKELSYTKAPPDNPLKGFMPYSTAGDDGFTSGLADTGRAGTYTFPHSMEWFYLPLSAVKTGRGAYRWDALEQKLNAIASRGHQAVFRFYLDYPAKPSGIPQYLIDDGLSTTPYEEYGGGLCPDYTNVELIDDLVSFIAAFGARFDGDPRIGFITAGLLGFWGEWHTSPHDDWMAGDDAKNQVLHAYNTAFVKTKLLVRYPAADSPRLSFGYHDDSFAYETLDTGGSNFLSLLVSAGVDGKWKTNPVGGEVRPEVQRDLFRFDPPRGTEDYDMCVDKTHASWLLDQSLFVFPPDGYQWITAVQAARRLGYEITATEASYDSSIPAGGGVKLQVRFRNAGVAPFYYDWTIEVGLRDASGRIAARWSTDWRLTRIQPGADPVAFSWSTPSSELGAGSYTLCIRVVNPLPGGKSLQFANVEQGGDGWLSIGGITAR